MVRVLTDLAQDIEDVDPDSEEARLMAGLLVPRALEAYCELNRVWGDKSKRLLSRVSELAPTVAAMAREFYLTGMRPDLAIAIADRVLAPFGGRIYEYHSGRTSV